MRKQLFTLVIALSSLSAMAQIKNADFEERRDTLPNLPMNWSIKKVDGFKASIDDTVKLSGQSSLKIEGNKNINLNIFDPFSQLVDVNIQQLQIMEISSYIKTLNAPGGAALWCQMLDRNNKMIGFQSFETQNLFIKGTNQWKQYTMSFTLDSNTKKLLIGGYLMGSGSAWFDQFSINSKNAISAPVSQDMQEFVNEVKNIIKGNSIFADSIHWNLVDTDLQKLSVGLQKTENKQLVVNYFLNILKKLGDNHSFIQSNNSANNYATANSVSKKPEGKLLNSNIGYIYVPAFASTNEIESQKFAQQIQNLIKKFDTENRIGGWIIDVRENFGGNMYPMIAGLGPLIGNGILGYFLSPNLKNNEMQKWFYKNGSSGIDNKPYISLPKYYTVKRKSNKIAVLIGPQTASSGEMTAISFKANPKARFFGQSTAGLTTANKGFKLSNGSYLYLAVSFVADVNSQNYLGTIQPDVLEPSSTNNDSIPSDVFNWLHN